MSARYTRSVSNKEMLSRRRHWREDQLDCLRRRVKAKLVRSPGGRYEEEDGSGGVACFSLIGSPIHLMLLVYSVVFSFASSLWFLCRVRHALYDKRLGQYH